MLLAQILIQNYFACTLVVYLAFFCVILIQRKIFIDHANIDISLLAEVHAS